MVTKKENPNLAAACFRNLESFFFAFERVANELNVLLNDPDRTFNLDENGIASTLDRFQRVFKAASKRNGDGRAVKSAHGESKHMTAVFATSSAEMLVICFTVVASP